MASEENLPKPSGSSIDNAVATLIPHAKYKARSHETSLSTHVPYLIAQPAPRIILFGNSMFERMKTTGQTPDGGPWPSPEILDMPATECFDDVFNAGVGGDKIGNNVYRLVGDVERGLKGLLEVLHTKEIGMWVVCCGTNDLHPKQGLRDGDLEVYRLMLEALWSVSGSQTRFLVVGMSHRSDIRNEQVDGANSRIRSMVESVGHGKAAVYEEPGGIDEGRYLEDHVHLNRDGYKAWMQSLVKKMREIHGRGSI